METSIRFIPESLSGMTINAVAGWLVEYVSSAWLGAFGVVATVVCTFTLLESPLVLTPSSFPTRPREVSSQPSTQQFPIGTTHSLF